MTIVFSSATFKIITMTVDSAISNEFSDHIEYDIAQKAYRFEGIGCVTTWGERTGNNIREYLDKCNLDAQNHSVVELANFVNDYLINQYKPEEYNLGEVGYHVAGFDRNHKPRLYHIFWSFDRPRIPDQKRPRYGYNDHSPQVFDQIQFLFNGRNDLAETLVKTLLIERDRAPHATKFKLDDPIDIALFSDFVARFAGEFTLQVGPPFYTILISSENKIRYEPNGSFCPIDREKVRDKLFEIDIR